MGRYFFYFFILISISCVGSKREVEKSKVNLDYIPQTLEYHTSKNYKTISVKNSKELMEVLKSHNIWDIKNNEVEPVLIKKFPKDFKKLRVKLKKKAFFHSMLPMILIVLNEIKEERENLYKIIEKYPLISRYTKANIMEFSFNDRLFIENLTKKYKATSRKELLKRVDVLPVSLIMAQTAIESAWGTSRFTLLGNNLFGVWSFNGKGIVPKRRKKGLKHRVAVYDTLLDSVRDYMLKINTVRAYKRLRNLRQKSKNSIYLTRGLLYYSQRRWDYVKDLIKMIKRNKLKKYDKLHLKEGKM